MEEKHLFGSKLFLTAILLHRRTPQIEQNFAICMTYFYLIILESFLFYNKSYTCNINNINDKGCDNL